MTISTALGNMTNVGRVRIGLGLPSTKGRLERRYYNIKALEPQGKDQIARGGIMKGSARVWRNSALGFGQMESLSTQR